MVQPKQINRRQFLLLGCGAAIAALCGSAYVASGCPLSNSGVCAGPCSAFIDRDRDGVCDRVQKDAQVVNQAEIGAGAAPAVCPFGLLNDPYPGQCGHYVDRNGNGICDFSEAAGPVSIVQPTQAIEKSPATNDQVEPTAAVGSTATFEPTMTAPKAAAPTPTAAVESTATLQAVKALCPFGLINDPYPGRCKRYRDQNGNGICDLSEPGGGSG